MRASFVLFLLPMLGCRSEEPAPVPSTSEADADTDTDTDSDTDSDTDADLVITSVFDIRQGEVDEYDEVNVEGLIVTGVSYSGMHCQDPAGGEYSGIYIYTGYDGQPEGVAVGDEISASGTTMTMKRCRDRRAPLIVRQPHRSEYGTKTGSTSVKTVAAATITHTV